jgi:hypothetical protein
MLGRRSPGRGGDLTFPTDAVTKLGSDEATSVLTPEFLSLVPGFFAADVVAWPPCAWSRAIRQRSHEQEDRPAAAVAVGPRQPPTELEADWQVVGGVDGTRASQRREPLTA